MLEHWYKRPHILAHFRRGPLGPHFDGFAGFLEREGFSALSAQHILYTSCLFNDFLIERDVINCQDLQESLIDDIVGAYRAKYRTARLYKWRRRSLRSGLNRLFVYLIQIKIVKPRESPRVPIPMRWIIDPYLQYLRSDCQLSALTIRYKCGIACDVLDRLGLSPASMKTLRAEVIEGCLLKYFKERPESRKEVISALRGFLHFCACRKYTSTDLSSVIPSVPSYRHAALPRVMTDAALQRVLDVVSKETAAGVRDYAIMLLMMAYGIRGKSAAELLLEDIDWRRSTIRIRAQKGGKEVVLPLLDAVGEAIIGYLHHRPETRLREVFLSVRAPFFALNSLEISQLVRKYMTKAGVKIPKSGSTTLRHSWAIRALAHDSPMKAIADVLGHRCLDTTFIYAKADLKTLRQVAMPWPDGR